MIRWIRTNKLIKKHTAKQSNKIKSRQAEDGKPAFNVAFELFVVFEIENALSK